MKYFLVIGEVTSAQYEPCSRRGAHIKRITEHQAVQGDSWEANETPDRLRELLGCQPTEIIGVIMPETVWLNGASILRMQYDYFPSCDSNIWVVRPDGTTEAV